MNAITGPKPKAQERHYRHVSVSGVRIRPEQQEVVTRLIEHRDRVYHSNKKLIDKHSWRVSGIIASMAVYLGLDHLASVKAIEGALIHDIGKHHPDCKAWLDKHRGLKATPEEVRYFRSLHTRMGVLILEQAHFTYFVSPKNELDEVCLHHNNPFRDVTGPAKQTIGLLQPADYFDARTSGEGDHVHDPIAPIDAISFMELLAMSGEFDQESITALKLSQGISRN